MRFSILVFLTLFTLAGSVHAQQSDNDVIQLSEPVEQTDEYRVFGSGFNSDAEAVALDSLIINAASYENKQVTTKGTIAQVCQKKGCFFILRSDDSERNARISFKDYSFFVPTNTAGSTVQLNGTFKVKTISEKDAKHYAEDAGEDPDAVNGPQKEYALVATSVKIYK